MTTQSVGSISENIILIKDQLKPLPTRLKRCGFNLNIKLGHENEYSVLGLIGGMNAILTDLTTIVKNASRFIQFTTYSERQAIAQNLSEITARLKSTYGVLDSFEASGFQALGTNALYYQAPTGTASFLPFAETFSYLDNIKPLLRNLKIRHDPERMEQLFSQLDELQRRSSEIENIRLETKATQEDAINIKNSIVEMSQNAAQVIEEITQKSTSLNNTASELQAQQAELSTVHSDAKKIANSISAIHTEVEESKSSSLSNEGVIQQFVKRIDQREKQLDNQKIQTDEYLETLEKYKKNHHEFTQSAEALILKARDALQLSGTVALGKHFKDQFNEARKYHWTWLVGGGVFLGIAIALGVWAIYEKNGIQVIVAKISLIPLALAGAWFCSSQYVKQKRIIEDYAYKKVLSLSLISFREELGKEDIPEQVRSYLETVLREIHRYPVDVISTHKQDRKNDTEDAELMGSIKKLFLDVIEKAVKGEKAAK